MPEAVSPLEALVFEHLSKYYPQEPDALELTRNLVRSIQPLRPIDFLGLLGETYRSLYKQFPLHHTPDSKIHDPYVERWRPYKLLLLLAETSSIDEVRQIPSQLLRGGPPSILFGETYKFYQSHSLTQNGKTFIENYSRLFVQPESVAALPEDPKR